MCNVTCLCKLVDVGHLQAQRVVPVILNCNVCFSCEV